MIVFTPAALPKIEPDDWGIFWDMWNKNSKPMVKKYINNPYSQAKIGTDSAWIGFDIYINTIPHRVSYEAPYIDIKEQLPKLYQQISTFDRLCYRIRLAQSMGPIQSHTDDNSDRWHLRSYFHYTDSKEQWYFTKPFNSQGKKTYIKRSTETNWFMYNDKHVWHGTDYNENHKKILLQVYSYNPYTDLANKSIEKYKDYTINVDEI